ncbi:MAG: hypothetical protein EXR41_05335 [Candidatus Methylopumilus sp.]|nr:hypothetical protein [Candidatus Methylopumilus sp.]
MKTTLILLSIISFSNLSFAEVICTSDQFGLTRCNNGTTYTTDQFGLDAVVDQYSQYKINAGWSMSF